MWDRIAFEAQISWHFFVTRDKKILACASPKEFNLYVNFFEARKRALPKPWHNLSPTNWVRLALRDTIQVRHMSDRFFVTPHLWQFLSPLGSKVGSDCFCGTNFVTFLSLLGSNVGSERFFSYPNYDIFKSVRFQSGIGLLLWHKFRDILKSVRFQCRVG